MLHLLASFMHFRAGGSFELMSRRISTTKVCFPANPSSSNIVHDGGGGGRVTTGERAEWVGGLDEDNVHPNAPLSKSF